MEQTGKDGNKGNGEQKGGRIEQDDEANRKMMMTEQERQDENKQK
jgi:hypothetical protein